MELRLHGLRELSPMLKQGPLAELLIARVYILVGRPGEL
jgi:hypothetical protein